VAAKKKQKSRPQKSFEGFLLFLACFFSYKEKEQKSSLEGLKVVIPIMV